MKKLKTIFMGTPDFAVPTLDILFNHPHIELTQIASMPSKKSGRGMKESPPPVIDYCQAHKIPFIQTSNINQDQTFLTNLISQKVDLIIVLAFAQFLGEKILNAPQIGCFNIHTSILPKYRGAAPMQHAILNGDSSTGVSIQKMVKKMDAGDICHFQSVPIEKHETGGSLYSKLKYQAALTLNQFVYDAVSKDLEFTVQDESKVSFAPTLKKSDGLLDFTNESFSIIDRKVRGLYPWPGTFFFLNSKRIKVFAIERGHSHLEPNEVSTSMGLEIGCKQGSVRILQLQVEGKKKVLDAEFINGLGNTSLKVGKV